MSIYPAGMTARVGHTLQSEMSSGSAFAWLTARVMQQSNNEAADKCEGMGVKLTLNA